MSNFVIFTDSACDMELKTLESWNVKSVNLTISTEKPNYFLVPYPS